MSFKTHSLSGISSMALALAAVHFAGAKGAGTAAKGKTNPKAPAPSETQPKPGVGTAPFGAPAGAAPGDGAEFTEDNIEVQAIADINAAGTSGMFAPLDTLGAMKHFGFVEVNEGTKDADGNVAVRITEAGAKWVAENVETGEETAPSKSSFEIDTDVAMPTGRGYAGRAGKYPFDALPIGGSFHIPATEDTPQPNARFGSAVTSANKRFLEAEKPNRFKIRAVGEDDPRGKGARVFRIA